MENWKDIKGYEGLYKVSSYGRIMTVRKNAILCPAKTISNGLTVSLSKNGKSKTKKAVDTGKPYKGIHYRIKIEK